MSLKILRDVINSLVFPTAAASGTKISSSIHIFQVEESSEQKNVNVFELPDVFDLLDEAYDLFWIFKYA